MKKNEKGKGNRMSMGVRAKRQEHSLGICAGRQEPGMDIYSIGQGYRKQNQKNRLQIHGNRRGIAALLAGLMTAALLTGCGSYDSSKAEMSSPQMNGFTSASTGGSYYEGSYDGGYGMADSSLMYESEVYEESSSQTTAGAGDLPAQMENSAAQNDRKLIRTVDMSVETKEYDALLKTLEAEVQSRGGYIESMDSYNGSSYSSYRNTRHASLTLRIPKGQLDSFLALVSEVGNIVRRSDNVEDVTLSYVDMESRRNALRTEQERLLALLEKAETIEDIITIEDRLSSVRYQLESMESRLRTIDNQVDYSTVYMDVSEVQELTPVAERTVPERIADGFMGTLKDIGNGVIEFIIWFLVNIPYLVIWSVMITVVVLVIRGIWKKKAKKRNERQIAANNQQVIMEGKSPVDESTHN